MRARQEPRRAFDLEIFTRPSSQEGMTERRVGRNPADARDLERHPLALVVLDLEAGTDAYLPTRERFLLDEHGPVQRSRIVLIRRSSSACSFFAAWYSKFSERSPHGEEQVVVAGERDDSTDVVDAGPGGRSALGDPQLQPLDHLVSLAGEDAGDERLLRHRHRRQLAASANSRNDEEALPDRLAALSIEQPPPGRHF
jgi:hypothetical protein